MQAKVKEFFNQLERKQLIIVRKMSERKRRRGQWLGMGMHYNSHTDKFQYFTHFIECEVSPAICPMQWEDLQFDFQDINRRFCTYCERYVYVAENIVNYKKLQEEGKCVAVNEFLFKKLQNRYDEKHLERLEQRLKLSKLFLVEKHYNSYEYSYEEDISYENLLILIITRIFESYNPLQDINWYIEQGVDMRYIFEEIATKVGDEGFQKKLQSFLNDFWDLKNLER